MLVSKTKTFQITDALYVDKLKFTFVEKRCIQLYLRHCTKCVKDCYFSDVTFLQDIHINVIVSQNLTDKNRMRCIIEVKL